MANTYASYSINQYSVEVLLGLVQADSIAIPDMQRPYVWSSTQVRDFIDSLYRGYPTGYLVISKSPNIRLKDGTTSLGKNVLIDGQQRVTSLAAALLGYEVRTSNYQKKHIKISFNPLDERFEVLTPAIEKSKQWIKDISVVFTYNPIILYQSYIADNPSADTQLVMDSLVQLTNIKNRQLGVIDLSQSLDSTEITEIFVRLNSQGKRLNEADFAMSKIAAHDEYDGCNMRKAVDYFCNLVVQPLAYTDIAQDVDFTHTDYFKAMVWLQNNNSDIYDPTYSDMLKVAFMHQFGRAKLSDLVALLDGRDFVEKCNKQSIAEDTFAKMRTGILNFMKEYTFTEFVNAITSAGFEYSKLLQSQNSLNFAYTFYLNMYHNNSVNKQQLKHYVQRWFVMSLLTGRYSGSAETQMNKDLKEMQEQGYVKYLEKVENTFLTPDFWSTHLVSMLEVANPNSPFFLVYLAAQIFSQDKSLLHNTIGIKVATNKNGDIHHIFPKAYLHSNGVTEQRLQNQVANFASVDKVVNVAIGDKEPKVYFTEALEQCRGGEIRIGTITDESEFWDNLDRNCIPRSVVNMTSNDYLDFLAERRKLMAEKIKKYYYSL